MPEPGWEDTWVRPAGGLRWSQLLLSLAPSPSCLTLTLLIAIQDHLNKPLALEFLPWVLWVWEPKLNQPQRFQLRVQQQGHSKTIFEETREKQSPQAL